MSARSARRPLPALIFLLALAILAVVVWVRVSQRDSDASAGSTPSCSATKAPASQLPANATVVVSVLNANGGSGLAKSTLTAFGALGFTQGSSDNYTGTAPVTGVGTVVAGPAGAAAAKLVAYYLPGATVTADDRTDTTVTVTIGQGFTALAGQDVAAAAIKAAGLSQASAAPAAPTSGAPSGTTSGTASGATKAAASPTSTC